LETVKSFYIEWVGGQQSSRSEAYEGGRVGSKRNVYNKGAKKKNKLAVSPSSEYNNSLLD
jgi:hypothetical protein